MRSRLRWTGAVAAVLVVVGVVGFGLVQHQLSQQGRLFPSGEAWFRSGSDTTYGGPLKPGQTYAEEGPRFANSTPRTVTLRGITLDHWCMWSGPGRCSPTANVHVVKALYLKGYGVLTNDRWPLSSQYAAMTPLLRPLSGPVALRSGTKIDTVYVVEASRPGVYLMPGRWIDYDTAFGPFHRTFRVHEAGQWALCVRPAPCPAWASSSP